MAEGALLCLGSFLAGCCSACWLGSKGRGVFKAGNRSLSAARKGRTVGSSGSPRSRRRSPTKNTTGTPGTAPSSVGSVDSEGTRDVTLWGQARSQWVALKQMMNLNKIAHGPSTRSSLQAREQNWRGRIWSFKLGAGASTSVEARFVDDGAHWIVIMKDRGPGIDVKAVLLTDDGEHELDHETGQSFHGQTPVVEGGAVLQLHFRNQHASFTERHVEVKMFLFHAGARIGEHSFVNAVLLKWMSDLMHHTFCRRDVKLKANSLNVVEVERVLHNDLWENYVRTRKSIMLQLSQQSNEHFAHSTTHCTMLTDSHVPLPLSQAANEHWLFHGTSAANVMSILDNGFEDDHHLTHGSAFGSGIYFTECSSKADMYTSPAEHTEEHDHGGLCCMLLCRVTLGRARKLDTQFHYDSAQIADEIKSGQYHSVLADREKLFSSYREFVTQADQAYPEFLIWYERHQKSSLQQWKDRNWGGDLF